MQGIILFASSILKLYFLFEKRYRLYFIICLATFILPDIFVFKPSCKIIGNKCHSIAFIIDNHIRTMVLKNVYVNGVLSDIEVSDSVITAISAASAGTCSDKPSAVNLQGACWAIPGMVNMHTHSAMTLLRSAGSGLPLQRWLNECIFPKEAKLTPDDIYRGALAACNEMLASGTTAFNDMYFDIESTVMAVAETGMSATIALSMTDRDFDDASYMKKTSKFFADFAHMKENAPRGISYAVAPHSIYAVSGKHLSYLADFATDAEVPFHIHLSETKKEMDDCVSLHGMPPVKYLDKLGIIDKLGNSLIAAHALWLSDDEIEILGSHKATVVHNPNSNLKLGSGHDFKYLKLKHAGANVTLGTDGCASSDNLDMVEAMKTMSLLQKGTHCDPSILPADEVFKIATSNGRTALGLNHFGLEVGKVADFCLVDLNNHVFNGLMETSKDTKELNINFLNRLIYAANGSAVCGCVIGYKATGKAKQ